MPDYLFNLGELKVLSTMRPEMTPQQIEDEPMLFQCSGAFALEHGGPATQDLLRKLLQSCHVTDVADLRVDTRSHMLMPTWYPCIPGWHCDFMEARADGSQVYCPTMDKETTHFQYVSDGPSPEFLDTRQVSVRLKTDELKWGAVSKYLNLTPSGLSVVKSVPGQIYKFDATELHRGTAWDGPPRHWRYFFRATRFPRGHSYWRKFANKIRKQTQVYCDVNAGW